MIVAYLTLIGLMLAWFAFLTLALFVVGRRLEWVAKPPTIDLIVILYSVAPWIAGWMAGARIHEHWSGGLAGMAAAVASQIIALELFDFIQLRIAISRGIRSLEINRTIDRRFGKWNNRVCLWLTVPSVPFFLLNRFTFIGYFTFCSLLGFTYFKHSDYVTVSRQKIKNLIGADLVWCLYCEWMTGGWTLSTEILNEIESYWCPLLFADREKCEKCSKYFAMGHWAQPDCTAEQISHVVGRTGSGLIPRSEFMAYGSEPPGDSRQPRASEELIPSSKA